MKLNTIHHVAIIVSDYERAKEFYVGKLGFQVLRSFICPAPPSASQIRRPAAFATCAFGWRA